jgi:hypothetical protein
MPRTLAGVLCLLLPCLAAAAEATGPQTLAYWTSVRDVVGKEALTGYFDLPLADRRDRESRDLEALVTAGVDPELVGFVKQVVNYAQGKAKADEALKWYHRYYWFRLPEVVVEVRKTKDALTAEGKRLRDVLSKRYGVDFPAFEFPDW